MSCNNKPTVGIIDFGLGNLFSIGRAVDYIGAHPVITDNPKIILSCNRLILPGVGAFGDGMKGLREKGLVEPIKIAVKSNIPLLGICLGMQLFMSQSQEFGLHYGLDLIKGRVVRFKQSEDKKIYYKIPHVGWNKLLYPCRNNQRQRHLECLKEDNPWQSTILEDLEEGSFVYFVHSYFVVPDKQENILAVTEYGNDVFCSVVASGNILGCQFHPERSGDAGLSIYRKFIFNNFS